MEIKDYDAELTREELRIGDACFQIGKKYAAKHSQDYEDEYAELMHVIEDAKKNIAALLKQGQEDKEETTEVQNTVQMEEAKPESAAVSEEEPGLEKEAKEFSAQTDEVEPDDEMKTCPYCHARIPAQAVFCTQCGQRMEQEQVSRTREEPGTPKMIHCPNCGAMVPAAANFCKYCGTSLGGSSKRNIL